MQNACAKGPIAAQRCTLKIEVCPGLIEAIIANVRSLTQIGVFRKGRFSLPFGYRSPIGVSGQYWPTFSVNTGFVFSVTEVTTNTTAATSMVSTDMAVSFLICVRNLSDGAHPVKFLPQLQKREP